MIIIKFYDNEKKIIEINYDLAKLTVWDFLLKKGEKTLLCSQISDPYVFEMEFKFLLEKLPHPFSKITATMQGDFSRQEKDLVQKINKISKNYFFKY